MPFNFGHVAGGDIYPARFVKVSTAGDRAVLACGTNEQPCGISQMGQRDAPVTGASDLAAASGEAVAINGAFGEPCLLEIGSGGVTRGANIKSDTDGKGVLSATTGATMQWIGAVALESASAGEMAFVQPVMIPHYPALS
jgi:hypothetical protein